MDEDQISNTNEINYALERNAHLDILKYVNEKDQRFEILKKYFTEKITKDIYQNMDLLYAASADFDQFKNMYMLISKDLYMNIFLAVNILSTERGISTNIITDTSETNDEYSICHSYTKKNKTY